MNVVKWITRVAPDKGKSLLPSSLITLAIVAMLILSGPVQAVAVVISGQDSYTKDRDIEFQVKIELNENDKYVPLTNISLDLTGTISQKAVFDLNGTRISGDCNIEMEPVSKPTANDFGYGYGYDSGYGYKFGYGYGYGYGYGGGGGKINFIYNVTIEKTCLPAGQYTVVATLNTDQKISFQSSPFRFVLAQAGTLNAAVEIKPETLNLASKGTFTAFITSHEFNITEIDGNTIRITCHGCNSVPAVKWNAADKKFIAKFRTQDLENVDTGDVTFTLTGNLKNGKVFEGNDTIRVIDQGKKDQKDDDDCDKNVKEHDDDSGKNVKEHDDDSDKNVKEHEDDRDENVKEHEDDCDKNVKEHDDDSDKNVKEHDDNKKIKNSKPEKEKDDDKKNKNNGGKGKTVVVNNIYIDNNTGTVNLNIYNQGGGTQVNQGNNNHNKKNGNGNNERRPGNNNKED